MKEGLASAMQKNDIMIAETKTIFRDGDVVAMVGDSITCDGRWWVGVREQVLAGEPGLACDFRNCGIPGDTAEGALRRYAWDIAPLRPSLALVSFGMNDVWRDAYGPDPTEEMLTRRTEALERFLINMHALVTRLLADGIRVVLLTPTPFDQYAVDGPTPNLPGVDDALAICAGMLRGLAIAQGLPVIDLHTPLRRRCAALEPLISDDRVHPNELGHEAITQVVIAAVLPSAAVPVPPALRAASRAVHAAEYQQRMIAMFRCWSEGIDNAAVFDFLTRNAETEPNPWVREQMQVCQALLPREDALAAEVTALRRQLAACGAEYRASTTRARS